MRPARGRRRRRGPARGSALLIVLGGLTLASAVALALLAGARSVTERTRVAVATAEARHIAEALVHRLSGTLADAAARSRLPLDGTPVAGRFLETDVVFRIRDERGKIDLNHCPPPVLGVRLALAGAVPAEIPGILDAWQDWRDGDRDRRLRGAEAADYEARGLPQRPRNGPLPAVDEFRRVLGVTAPVFESMRDDLTVHAGAPTIDPWTASAAVLLAATGAPPADIDRFIDERRRVVRPLPPPSIIAGLTAQSEELAYAVSVTARSAAGISAAVEVVIGLPPGLGAVFLDWR